MVFSFLLQLKWGSVDLSWEELFTSLFHFDEHTSDTTSQIIHEIRLPRALTALMIGGSLSVSGLLFQSLLRNPLGDPYLLGISSAATFCRLLWIVLFSSLSWPIIQWLGSQGSAFLGALMTVFLLTYFSKDKSFRFFPLRLILFGVILSFFFAGLSSLLIFLSPQYELFHAYYWISGHLGFASYSEILGVSPLMVFLILGFWAFAPRLDILFLEENLSHTSGLAVHKIRWITFLGASLLTSLCVALAGSIGFVGLVVPHVSRSLIGTYHRQSIPFTFFLGAGYLLLCDAIARSLIESQELPVGVITALLGCPFFLFLFERRTKSNRELEL